MTNLKPCRKKMIVSAGAKNEGPDQPAHPSAYPCDLIRCCYLFVYSAVSNTYITKILLKKRILGKRHRRQI